MSTELTPALREKIENTLRFLTMDAVQKAGIGHVGAPLGLARPAFELWDQVLRFDPGDPNWPLRDRFVLSNGHASMLLYGLLHLFGFDLSMDDIRDFRQLGSRTPGHPEYGDTPGVEVTTGPLGQGFAHAVGMALAGRIHKVTQDFHAVFTDPTPLAAYRWLRSPVLLVGGEHSPAPARRVSDLLSATLPDARQAVLQGAGHMLPLTHAETLAALIRGHIANSENGAKSEIDAKKAA